MGENQDSTLITINEPSSSLYNSGRWTKGEHIRFLEALKVFGKNWRKV